MRTKGRVRTFLTGGTYLADAVELAVARSDPDPRAAERLLRLLPNWFGIESSTQEYVEDARHLPTYLAAAAGQPPVGILLVRRHFPEAAEVHLMAVDPAWHRRGIGRRLLAAAERDLSADDVRLLQVKTLSASRPDPNYGRTREFYLAMGFLPLEELLDLWPDNPCLVMVKPLAATSYRVSGCN